MTKDVSDVYVKHDYHHHYIPRGRNKNTKNTLPSKTLIKKDPFQLLKETIIPNMIALTAKCQNYEE